MKIFDEKGNHIGELKDSDSEVQLGEFVFYIIFGVVFVAMVGITAIGSKVLYILFQVLLLAITVYIDFRLIKKSIKKKEGFGEIFAVILCSLMCWGIAFFFAECFAMSNRISIFLNCN